MLVDLENSPYLEVDSSVVLVRETVVDNLVVVVFLLVLEAELELEGFADDDEGSPPVSSFLVFFSSCFTGFGGAGLFGGGGGPSG